MFRTDSSGDVFEQLIDGQWQPEGDPLSGPVDISPSR
jgi:hypothetical protein